MPRRQQCFPLAGALTRRYLLNLVKPVPVACLLCLLASSCTSEDEDRVAGNEGVVASSPASTASNSRCAASGPESKRNKDVVLVFFPCDKGYVSEPARVASGQDRLRAIAEKLADGPSPGAQASGLQAVLAPGVRVLHVSRSETGSVRVDLDLSGQSLQRFDAGSSWFSSAAERSFAHELGEAVHVEIFVNGMSLCSQSLECSAG